MSKGSKNERRKQTAIQFITFMGDRWVVTNTRQTREGVLYGLAGAIGSDWFGTRLNNVPLSFINSHKNEPLGDEALWQFLVS